MKFKRNLIGVLVTITLQPAYADTASIDGTSGMGLLINEWVKAGVNANTGTLGSGGGTSPGLLYDPTGTGTFNPSYDYLTPGSPFDGFSLKVDSTNKTNNNTGSEQITGQGVVLSNSNQTLSWSGSATYGADTWNLTNAYTLAPNTPYVDITTTIVAGGAATDVYYAKFIDPDSQGMPGDSSATDNVLGYGVIPSTNVAFSEATVSRYALGLYSAANNVSAGINGWSTDAASYINADASCGTGVLYCNGDDTIGLTFHWTAVSAGDTLTARYAYIFGPSAFGAASSAVDGGAGGGTPGEAPGGGTLTDVGSATDAAAGSSEPTITGTSTVNGTATYADTTGDSVEISSSIVAGDYLTRTYNEQSTTAIGRTTTTPTTVVTTWSDSTTTSAAGASIVVPETYYYTVAVEHNDVAREPVANGDPFTVSEIDLDSVRTTETFSFNESSKVIRASYTWAVTGNEIYTTTTPKTFTYDRTTTTTTTNDFSSSSIYADTTSTATTTSVETQNYDIITSETVARSASVNFTADLRVDQVTTANKLHRMINRDIEFGKNVVYKYYDHNTNGYSGRSNVFGFGYTKDIAGDMNLGIGINKIDTSLSGHSSNIRADAIQLGATLYKSINGYDIKGTLQHTHTDYDTSASPVLTATVYGDNRLMYSESVNLGTIKQKTSGKDTSMMIRVTGPGTYIRPVVGATVGRLSVDGSNANWDIQPGVRIPGRIDGTNDTYSFATVGAVAKYGLFNATALHHTDGVNQFGVGLEKVTNKLTFNLRADRLELKDGGSNLYTANMIYQF